MAVYYVERYEVESVFRDDDALRARSFAMGMATDVIINEQISDTLPTSTGSKITISGSKSVNSSDKSIDVIARVLI